MVRTAQTPRRQALSSGCAKALSFRNPGSESVGEKIIGMCKCRFAAARKSTHRLPSGIGSSFSALWVLVRDGGGKVLVFNELSIMQTNAEYKNAKYIPSFFIIILMTEITTANIQNF